MKPLSASAAFIGVISAVQSQKAVTAHLKK